MTEPTKRGFGTGAGRQRVYPSNAAKQQAYRNRKKQREQELKQREADA